MKGLSSRSAFWEQWQNTGFLFIGSGGYGHD